MTTNDEIIRVRSRINLQHIDLVAGACSAKIAGDGWAAACLTPGDMTVYRIIITPCEAMVEEPDGDCTWAMLRTEWTVSLVGPSGFSYGWSASHPLDVDYVYDKWCINGTGIWTAVVLTEFLNALRVYLEEK